MKAVIFDFEGLILDTKTAWFEAIVKCIGANDTVLLSYLEKEIGSLLNVNTIRESV